MSSNELVPLLCARKWSLIKCRLIDLLVSSSELVSRQELVPLLCARDLLVSRHLVLASRQELVPLYRLSSADFPQWTLLCGLSSIDFPVQTFLCGLSSTGFPGMSKLRGLCEQTFLYVIPPSESVSSPGLLL